MVANRALDGDGGGVSATRVSATNTTFTGNAAATGSALGTAGGELVHTTVVDNSFGGGGTVVSVDAGGELLTRSSILLDPCSGTITSPALSVSLVEGDVCWSVAAPRIPKDRSSSGHSAVPVGRSPGPGHEIPVLIPPFSTGAPCAVNGGRPWRACARRRARSNLARSVPSSRTPWALTRHWWSTRPASTPRTATPATGCATRGTAGCTLRAAVMESQALPSADTIEIAAGVGPIILTTPHCNPATDLNGRCADLDISRGDVTIRGDADGSTISATVGRIFDLSTNVTLAASRPRRRARPRRARGRQPRVRASTDRPAGHDRRLRAAWRPDHRPTRRRDQLHRPWVAGPPQRVPARQRDAATEPVGVGAAIGVEGGAVSMVGVRAEGNRAQFRSAFSIQTPDRCGSPTSS